MAELDLGNNKDVLDQIIQLLKNGSIADLEKLGEAVVKFGKVSKEAFANMVSESKEKLGLLGDTIGAVKLKLNEMIGQAPEVREMLEGIAGGVDSVFSSVIKFNPELTKAGIAFTALAAGLSDTFPKDNMFTSLAGDAKNSAAEIDNIISNVGKFTKLPGMTVATLGMAGVATGLFKAGEGARNFQTGLISSTASSGQLNTLIESMGGNLDNLDGRMLGFIENTVNVGNATGFGSKQVGAWATKLNEIPGALDEIVKTSAVASGSMVMLESAIRLSASTGMNMDEINKQLADSFINFGTSGQKALEVIARMSTTTSRLKMPLSLVQDYTRSAAGAFKFFGDNSQSALNILNKYGPALKAVGLGSGAIKDLTAGIVTNISQMTTAQNAFLSASSGGPGGLMGAARIEKLKMEGKTDEVQAMIEKSLRQQFGGQIFDNEDATKSESAASQYTKQKMLLQSGPTKIANSDIEAAKILAAMKKGLAVSSETGAEALDEKISLGKEVQDRTFDNTVKISNRMEMLSAQTSLINEQVRRGFSGRRGIAAAQLSTSATPEQDIDDASGRAQQFKMYAENADTKKNTDSGSEAVAHILETLNPTQRLLGATAETLSRTIGLGRDKVGSVMDYEQSKTPGLEEVYGSEQTRPMQGIVSKIDTPRERAVPLQEAQQIAGKSTAEIMVHVKCDTCSKDIMKQTSLEVVNGRLQEVESSREISRYTGAGN